MLRETIRKTGKVGVAQLILRQSQHLAALSVKDDVFVLTLLRVADDLAPRMAAAALLVPREAAPPAEFAHLYPDVMEKVTPEILRGTVASLLARTPVLDLSHVTPIRATLADALAVVQERLATRSKALFRDLLDDCEERIEVVVRFLAILELYREGKVELQQATTFGEIEVEWRG